jgi:hypothetical protein
MLLLCGVERPHSFSFHHFLLFYTSMVAAADAGDDAVINDIIRRAVEAINVEEEEQEIYIEDAWLIVDGFNAQYIVNFLFFKGCFTSCDAPCRPCL